MKYTALAETIRAKFLSEFNLTAAQAEAYIERMRSINAYPLPTVAELLTPRLGPDQETIVFLVAELDVADKARKAQIKYQLKHYYHFNLQTLEYTPKKEL